MRSNRRRFIRNGVAIGAATGLAGCFGYRNSDDRYEIRAAAATGGRTEAFLQAISTVVDEASEEIRVSVEPTAGDRETMRRFDAGEVNAPAMTNWSLASAWNGEGMFAGESFDPLPLQGLTLTTINLHWVATAESGIETTDDLVGRAVFPLPDEWGLRDLAGSLHSRVGDWEELDENAVELGVGDVAEAVSDGRVEAFVHYFANGTLPPWSTDMNGQFDLVVPTPTDAWRQGVRDTHGPTLVDTTDYYIYEGKSVDASLADSSTDPYAQDVGLDEVGTCSVGVQLLFGEDVPDDAVYELADISHRRNEWLRDVADGYPDHTRVQDTYPFWIVDVPIHPGMAKFVDAYVDKHA